MKKAFYVVMIAAILLGSCSLFKNNEKDVPKPLPKAYLIFTNPKDVYPDGVEVYVNKKPAFIAMVSKFPFKDNRCVVEPGHLQLKVVYEGTTILRDTIDIKKNQTKTIVLPTVTDIW